MARLDAPDKVAGRTTYAADLDLPGLCHVALVRSPFAHARITRLDTAEAAGLPGVIGVFTGQDLSGKLYGRAVLDVPVLAWPEVRYAGERVAAVVAESRALAERAAARVRVEYEQLPAVFGAEEALKPGAPRVHEAPWEYAGAVVKPEDGGNLQSVTRHSAGGDVDAALASAAFRVDSTYTTPREHQGYLEPQACVARVDTDGTAHIWAANKSPFRLRSQMAKHLGLDPAAVVIHPVAVGGDFGGKGSPMDAPLCLELSQRVGRPIKLSLRYAEDLMAANPRHSSRIRVRVGCDRDGHLVGLDLDALFDGGAYAAFKPRVTVDLHGVEEAGSSYRIPAVRLLARIAYTNTVPGGHMRSPGAPQTVFAVESAVDELATAAGIDPVEFRRRNILLPGDTNPYGHRWPEVRGLETLDAALAAYRPVPVPPGWLHGRGVAVYDRSTSGGRSSMRLRAEPSGGVRVFVPFPETGTGSHTVVQRIVAEDLGLDPARVTVEEVSTADLPHDDGVGGSRVTAGVSALAQQAAAAFRAQGAQGEITVVSEQQRSEAVTGFCVQIAQVAVDAATGKVRVLEVLSAVDVGEVINPVAHQIQIEGGMAMGFGFACLEDLAMTEGRVEAANLGDFKLPSARDVPSYRVALVPGGRGVGPRNVKSIGETGNVPTAAAIANAVHAAAGVRIRDLPITAEAVFFALHREEASSA
jgi:putative selenate reductase molybdopterin-binding subunit